MISSTVFPVISDGNFGVVDTTVVTLALVPLLEATTRDDEVWAAVVLEMEGTVAAEQDGGRPKAGAGVVDCACDDARVDVLVDKENPVNELVVPEEADELVTPKPVKEPTVPDDEEELPMAAVATVLTEDEEGVTPKEGKAGTEVAAEEAVALLADGVEALLVVVTVENNEAEDVPSDRDVGFAAAGVLEAVEADDAALPIPKED